MVTAALVTLLQLSAEVRSADLLDITLDRLVDESAPIALAGDAVEEAYGFLRESDVDASMQRMLLLIGPAYTLEVCKAKL